MDKDNDYSGPLDSPSSTTSSSSYFSSEDSEIFLDEVTPFDSISQCGNEREDTTNDGELPVPVFEDHGYAIPVLTASSVSSRSEISSLSNDSMFASAVGLKDPVSGLNFVKRCDNIDGLAHFKLTLNADRKLEEQQAREAFVPLPDDMVKDPEPARNDYGGKCGSTASKASTEGRSDSGYGTSTGPDLAVEEQRNKDDHDHDHDHDHDGPPSSPDMPEQFSNKYFEVRKSELAGYGAFARLDLTYGQKILVEPELFHADSVSLYDEFDMLSDGSKKAFKRMAAHCPTSGFDEVTSIFRTNSFNVGGGQAGIFLVAARFNHACANRNNVSYKFNDDKNGKRRITFETTKHIPAGTELTITYGSCPEELYSQWGFVCMCGGCKPLSDEDVARLASGINWN
ncbi:set 5 [Apiospora saccharicola]|uniref:Set 5 n=1 Tax=Apiospora saccharicola TaxID=335842 RepID=A0ABR1VLC2_9PEZI